MISAAVVRLGERAGARAYRTHAPGDLQHGNNLSLSLALSSSLHLNINLPLANLLAPLLSICVALFSRKSAPTHRAGIQGAEIRPVVYVRVRCRRRFGCSNRDRRARTH